MEFGQRRPVPPAPGRPIANRSPAGLRIRPSVLAGAAIATVVIGATPLPDAVATGLGLPVALVYLAVFLVACLLIGALSGRPGRHRRSTSDAGGGSWTSDGCDRDGDGHGDGGDGGGGDGGGGD